jgi:hypothetical protein
MTETDPGSPAPAATASQVAQPTTWAIVELMGHQRIAGRISQQTLGSVTLIRVDVPEVVLQREQHGPAGSVAALEVIPAHTRSLGAAAIYGIHWVDEAAATLAAHSIRHQPVQPYALRNVLGQMPAAQRQRMLGLMDGTSLLTTTAGDDDDPF